MAIRKQSNRIIIIDYKKEMENSEIDLDLLENMFPGYSNDDNMDNYPQIERKGNNNMAWAGDQEVIKIKDVQKIIDEFKSLGCTHMEIMYHGDHNGYCFYGAVVSKANSEMIKKLENAEKEKWKGVFLQRKIKLQKEIAEIDKEIK